MKIEATEEELADLMRALDAAVRRDGLPMASIATMWQQKAVAAVQADQRSKSNVQSAKNDR